MALLSRNDIDKYSYFFVTKNNKRTLSQISLSEFFVYKFENPVTENRGKTYLTDEYVTSVYAMSDDSYKKEGFIHPKYTNQKNQPISFKYTELPVVDVRVEDSRTVK
mgnify:FL=1|jgi:hypothetical protein